MSVLQGQKANSKRGDNVDATQKARIHNKVGFVDLHCNRKSKSCIRKMMYIQVCIEFESLGHFVTYFFNALIYVKRLFILTVFFFLLDHCCFSKHQADS